MAAKSVGGGSGVSGSVQTEIEDPQENEAEENA